MNELKEKEAVETVPVFLFKIGNNEFCIMSNIISEIVLPKEITRIPKSPDFISGITNLRGEIIGVINLTKILSLETSFDITGPETRLIVVKPTDEKVGMIVSKVEGIYNIRKDKIELLDKYNFCHGRASLNNRKIIILDIDDILNLKGVKNNE